MNNKIFKTILGTLLGTMLFSAPTFAAGLAVEFETDLLPLFNETNFTPGDSIQKWAKVTNTSGETKAIITEAIKVVDGDSDGNKLGDVLEIEINDSTGNIYSDTLTNFFNVGELYLSDVTNGVTEQYDYIISFIIGADNEYQADNLGFDILIGFEGEEGGVVSGGGGGGGTLPGLTIYNEGNINASSTSATITWNTSYDATSRVIYDISPNKFDFSAGEMKYGYADYKDGDDIFDFSKGTYHSVTLTGLTFGTTYYYRCVSHASPATIGQEHSFTTLTKEEAVAENDEFLISNAESNPNDLISNENTKEGEGENIGVIPSSETGVGAVTTEGETVEGEESSLEGDLAKIVKETAETSGKAGLFGANLVSFLKNIPWWLLVIIAVLIFLGLFLTRKKHRKEKQGKLNV